MQLFISFLAICLYTTTTAAISAEHKTLLLLLHNTFREKILNCTVPGQPPAAQMPKMTWNDQLAEKAQTWSDKCKVGHDRNQDRLVAPFRWVGQNFAGNSLVENGFYAWFDEHKNYDYANNNCTKVCGHYTQVVWAGSTQLGCGVTQCPRNQFPYGFSIVCNYGPGGNYVGQRPYKVGDKSKCPKKNKIP